METPKRGRGRPRKDPNKTDKEPYVIKPYKGIGRPPKNPHPTWGGAREGAGRPAYVPESEKVKESINFRVDSITKERYRRLQKVCNMSEILRSYINRLASTRLGAENVPDNWTPPKKKA